MNIFQCCLPRALPKIHTYTHVKSTRQLFTSTCQCVFCVCGHAPERQTIAQQGLGPFQCFFFYHYFSQNLQFQRWSWWSLLWWSSHNPRCHTFKIQGYTSQTHRLPVGESRRTWVGDSLCFGKTAELLLNVSNWWQQVASQGTLFSRETTRLRNSRT